MPPENLPVQAEEIIDGEIVSEDAGPRLPVTRVVRTVVVVVKHPVVKHPARHVSFIPLGAYVAWRKIWESRSAARFDRAMRAAQATGAHDVAIKWEELRQKWQADRHRRRMERAAMILNTFRMAPRIAAASVGVLAAIGLALAVAEKNFAEIKVPFVIVARIVMWVAIAVSVSWGPFVLAAPWLAVIALWYTGRQAAGTPLAPGWARTAMDPDADVSIDETTIARALEGLRIPQIRDYLKQGLPLQYITTCRQEGRGTYAKLRLPVGVTAERIARRRADLATGLYRQAKEVWPSTGSEAGELELWVADKGALEEGAGPYPLLEDGFADVFRGLPFGRSLRGDPVRIPVIGRNTICGGIPEQGKSSAARIVAAGYTLDIRTELRILVPDTNFDFEVFRPRCSRYVMGAEDEHIEAILRELEDLNGELQRRGQLLVDCGQPEVTEDVAAKVPGLHPLFVLLEEAHIAIQHREHGKEISRLLCDIVKLDRKRGVHFMVSTQAPTKDNMPRDVTRNCSNGIAFAVGDHTANDGLLGQGAYRAGHRATELIPGVDKGTALCKGLGGERSEMVQVHFLSVRSDHDQVTPLVNRALAEIRRRGLEVPGTGRALAVRSQDLLEDVRSVTGSDRVLLRDLLGLLRDHAPGWAPYKSMTATALRAQLQDRGVRVINSSGTYWLDPGDVPGGETAQDS